MRVLVDGVCFQQQANAMSRLWRSLIPRLAEQARVFVLDRGDTPALPGVIMIPFPAYTGVATAADSLMIQRFCDHYAIDVFCSTDHTTPVRTPSVLVLDNMTAERLALDPAARARKEKELAILYAQRIICLSQAVRRDLRAYYHHTDLTQVVTATPGIDRDIFNPPNEAGLTPAPEQSFILYVGERLGALGHRGGESLIRALVIMKSRAPNLIFVGGKRHLEPELENIGASELNIELLHPTDLELSDLYRSASALVRPGVFGGTALPVQEAMACGCVVITTEGGAAAELVGSAGIVTAPQDASALAHALHKLRTGMTTQRLRAAGVKRAETFDWSALSDVLLQALDHAAAEGRRRAYRDFARNWAAMRKVQAAVDVEAYVHG